jgi:hypothetical protein
MPKKNYFLWARRATGTLPPLGREKGGGADEFRKDLSRARGQPGVAFVMVLRACARGLCYPVGLSERPSRVRQGCAGDFL